MLSDQQLLDCQVLRGVAGVLDLSAVATVTALTFLHRVQEQQQQQQQQHTADLSLSQQDLVCACIYLAAKVEEVHVSTNQLINTARVLADPTQQHLLQALAPLPLALPQQQAHQEGHNAHATTAAAAAPPPADTAGPSPQQQQRQQQQQQQQTPVLSAAIVVGDEYYAAKEQLFIAEQALLRTMRFELGVQQPHKHLLNYVALLELSQHTAAAAVCVLNDAVAYTRVMCTHSAAVVAAAALQHVLATTAAAIAEGGGEGVVSRGRSSREQQVAVASGHWVSLVGLPDAEVAAAQQEIAGLYRCLAVAPW